MNFVKTVLTRNPSHLLSALALALALVVVLAAWLAPRPRLSIEYNDTAIEIYAEKAWIVLPNQCLQIGWIYDGSLPIHVDGKEWRESGEQQFCPTMFATSPKIELTDHRNNVYRSYQLNINFFPEFAVNLVGVAAILFLALLGLQYLWRNDLHKRPAFREAVLATLILVSWYALARLSGRAPTIETMLAYLGNLFGSAHWHSFGALMAGLLYIPMALRAIWGGTSKKPVPDIVAITGFTLFVLLLYLPFGFATVAQWDGWTNRAYLENLPWPRLETELALRPFVLVHAVLARATGPESFVGLNVLHALLLWAKPVMIYGILRELKVRRLFAFLVTTLFLVYPVDSRLLSVQAIILQFSFVCLLTAIYLAQRYASKPTRANLVGIWLALGLCVGTYETALGLILVAPLIWWHQFRKMTIHNLNLMGIWYVVPAVKVVYVCLLLFARRSFYQSDYIYSGSDLSLSDLVANTFHKLFGIYQRTFAVGWSDALNSIGHNESLPLTLLLLGLFVFIAWFMWRGDKREWVPENRQLGFAFVISALLILPSVAVLIWFDNYNNDLIGLYLYIPVPAAIALFCLIALLTSPIASNKLRNATIAGLCLLLTLPALSRLVAQHEHYVTSANNKARILAQIAQLAPALESQTRVLVLSEMSSEEFQDKHIEAFTSTALGHALYVIYEGQGAGRGSICPSIENCFPLLHRQAYLKDTIVFTLDKDLKLELVKEPGTMLEAFVGIDYDLSRLYNADAPVPSRAYSMLGLSIE